MPTGPVAPFIGTKYTITIQYDMRGFPPRIASISQLMEPIMPRTATLKNAYLITNPALHHRAPCVNGQIYGDSTGEFPDGAFITTSTVDPLVYDAIGICLSITTRSGSVYQIDNWVDELASGIPATPKTARERQEAIDDVAAEEALETVEQPAPVGETPAQAFKRLVIPRVTTAIKRIQLIGNLSNRSSYEYTEAQIAKVFSTMRTELDAAEKRFAAKSADQPLFSLDD